MLTIVAPIEIARRRVVDVRLARLRLCVALAGVIALPFSGLAQSPKFANPAPAEKAPEPRDLAPFEPSDPRVDPDDVVSRLEADVAAEEARVARAREGSRSELALLEARRRETAAAVLELELDVERMALRTNEVREALSAIQSERGPEVEALQTLVADGSRLADRLETELRGIPGSDERLEALRGLGARIRDESFEISTRLDALDGLLTLAVAVHGDASTVARNQATVRTATGRSEAVDFLRAGHVAFAYLASDGRAAIALASPSDAAGVRWTERIGASIRRQIDAVARDSAGNSANVVDVPFDPTGRLGTDAFAERELFAVIISGGPVMVPICIVALIALLLVLERSWFLARHGADGSRFLESVRRACVEGRFEDAEEHVRASRGVVARTLDACLSRRRQGQRAMEDAVQAQILQELPRLQRFLRAIGVLAGVAPLLGLLGTVTGIIQTFAMIKVAGSSEPALLAGGISEALVTTAAGLIIAIPVLLLHHILSAKVDRILSDAEKSAATLLTTLEFEAPT
jgi:biopolymer transport protein ExbB